MLSTIFQLVGIAAVVAGVLLLSIPVGVIVGGIALVLVGLAVAK